MRAVARAGAMPESYCTIQEAIAALPAPKVNLYAVAGETTAPKMSRGSGVQPEVVLLDKQSAVAPP